ncbi:unnamed protein product [Lactuca virosa]|uniref:Uncharacterized protein n=1 Tax=Lactuca virosa TaxID=75947 RepID=A0AAU9PBJ7_9ASTR|nr:unnamed protein product [Lactuca virosa]
MEYFLTVEGKKNCIDPKITSIDLYFRCNDCRRVFSEKVKMEDPLRFDLVHKCDCENLFTMTEIHRVDQNSKEQYFTFEGNFSISKKCLTDADVSYHGKVFGHKVPIDTTRNGRWVMALQDYNDIAPVFKYEKRNVGTQHERASSSDEDNDERAKNEMSLPDQINCRLVKIVEEKEKEVVVIFLSGAGENSSGDFFV